MYDLWTAARNPRKLCADTVSITLPGAIRSKQDHSLYLVGRRGQHGILQCHNVSLGTTVTHALVTDSSYSSLHQIMCKVIDTLYNHNIGCSTATPLADLASAIHQAEQQLVSWQASLPASLKLISAEELAADSGMLSLEKKLRVILTLRYHNLRILAHRPVLDRYLQLLQGYIPDPHEASILWQISHRSKSSCFQSADAIVSVVSTTTHSSSEHRNLLGAWWFTLYYSMYGSWSCLTNTRLQDCTQLLTRH